VDRADVLDQQVEAAAGGPVDDLEAIASSQSMAAAAWR
jgi:hypothetical protein